MRDVEHSLAQDPPAPTDPDASGPDGAVGAPGPAPDTSGTRHLAEAARSGDEEAMHELVLRILPRVRNGVRYLVRGDVIEDLVQDVLVTVLERLDSYSGSGRFESWVDGVTMRVVIGRMRKVRDEPRRLAQLQAEEITLLHNADRYATSRQLVWALDQVPDKQRQALVLHHVFGLTAPEIAARFSLPHETVRSRLRDGLARLRALLRVSSEVRP